MHDDEQQSHSGRSTPAAPCGALSQKSEEVLAVLHPAAPGAGLFSDLLLRADVRGADRLSEFQRAGRYHRQRLGGIRPLRAVFSLAVFRQPAAQHLCDQHLRAARGLSASDSSGAFPERAEGNEGEKAGADRHLCALFYLDGRHVRHAHRVFEPEYRHH